MAGKCTCYLFKEQAQDKMFELIREARRKRPIYFPELRRKELVYRDLAAPITKDPVTGELKVGEGEPIPPREGVASDVAMEQITDHGVFWTRATPESPEGGAIDSWERVFRLDPATVLTMAKRPADCYCIGSRNRRRVETMCFSPPVADPVWDSFSDLYRKHFLPALRLYFARMKEKYNIVRFKPGMALEWQKDDQEEGRLYLDMYEVWNRKAMEYTPRISECRVPLRIPPE